MSRLLLLPKVAQQPTQHAAHSKWHLLGCTGLGLVHQAVPQSSLYLAMLILQQAVPPALSAGAYRQMQARLRSNSESIAFYGGIDKEATLLKDKFRQVLQHNGRLLVKQWQFGMVQVRPRAPDTVSDAAKL